MAITWTAVFHYADVEYGTSAYNETALTNVSALTGYDWYELTILAVHEVPEGQSAIMYADGSLQSSRIARRTYTLKSAAKTYVTYRHVATNAMITLMQKPYLWVELNTRSQDGTTNVGATSEYHTTNYVIPVTIDTISVEEDDTNGQKYITINLKHRFYNT
jgi:hypothetical protein